MVEELIQRMFAIRNAAHIEHWQTGSYAQHMALGDFYGDVIDLTDKYVEAHQGTFGIVEDVKGEVKDISRVINDEIIWLHDHREEIAQGVPALENILDEISGLHMKTLYKLENLK
jgi:hypothetical protein